MGLWAGSSTQQMPQMTAMMDVTRPRVNKPPKICKAEVGGRDSLSLLWAALSVSVGLVSGRDPWI